MNGQLERTDNGPRLRFERELDHPVERVWQALIDPQDLQHWFPQTINVDRWELGAQLDFGKFSGEVTAYDPPQLLEFTWGADLVRLELEATSEGTRLTLLDTLDELGKAARDGAGWHVCLDRLAAALDGTEPQSSWQELHPAYVERMGPEAATIGPPA